MESEEFSDYLSDNQLFRYESGPMKLVNYGAYLKCNTFPTVTNLKQHKTIIKFSLFVCTVIKIPIVDKWRMW
jgi:hypothetical protein